jgi:hypothetical protein
MMEAGAGFESMILFFFMKKDLFFKQTTPVLFLKNTVNLTHN